jgi:flagellar hook-length control protein FliK
MGAGAPALSTPGPVPAASDVRAPGCESGPQISAGSGARFTDAMSSARGSADSPAETGGSQAVPARVDTAPRARAARGGSPTRTAAPTQSAPAGAAPEGAPPGAASSEPAAAGSGAAPSNADAVAEFLPGLVADGTLKGAGASADGGALASTTNEGAGRSEQDGAAIDDPAGLLALMLGVAPAVSGTTARAGGGAGASAAGTALTTGAPATAISDASAGAIAGAIAGAGAGAGARAGGANSVAGSAASGAVSTPAMLQTADTGFPGPGLPAQLAALPQAVASSVDGGDGQAAQGTAGPPVQALSDLMRAIAPAVSAAAPAERYVAVPVGSAGWPGAVAAQVHWLASGGVSSATLHLSPEHLGPVQVYIDLQSSQVNVSFSAAHADTRAALEQALPKLREMFATGGLALGQASVQQESRPGSEYAAPARVTRVTESTTGASPLSPGQSLGLVDEYA